MMLRRTPLARKTGLARGDKPLAQRTPLRSRPSKRARPDESLAVWCEAALEGVCTGQAVHRHHRLRRSQLGGDEKGNTLDLCGADHRAIHDNPGWSARHGLLSSRGFLGPVVPGCALDCLEDHRDDS